MTDAAAFDAGLSETVRLARILIRIPAMSGGEGPVAEAVEASMRALGYRDVRRDAVGNVTGLVGPDGPVAVLYDGHMDVVAATGAWSGDPFGGEVVGDRLKGRGATDMKGPLAAALVGVAEAAATGRLTRAVAVSASVLEETVEGAALARVLDELDPAAVVICEPSSLVIKTAQRGRIEILIDALGIPAHAAHPETGRNAVDLAARALVAIAQAPLPKGDVLGQALIAATDIISDPWPSVSALPACVTIRLDRRLVDGETCDGVMAMLRTLLDGLEPGAFRARVSDDPVASWTGAMVRPERDLPAWIQSPESPLARAAAAALEANGRPAVFGVYAFCTNGSESAGRRGLPTIGLGPGAEADAHRIDESISIEELDAATAIYRDLALDLAGDTR